MPEINPVRRTSASFPLFRMLILFGLMAATSLASTPQPTLAPITLHLTWSAPEPVLSGGRVTRPYVHQSAILTLGARQQAEVLRTQKLTILRPALGRVYSAVEARQPRDVRFSRSGSGWTARARTGWRVDRAESERQLLAALVRGNRSSRLQLKLVAPRRSVSWTAQWDLKHLATGTSTFTGSPEFRVHNLRLGASRIHGLWLAPSETFDFNARLGPVSVQRGFQPGYVVTGNTLSVEEGGGVCQVSTTVFRAALLGGFPIVERHAHSYQVGYYGEPGQDAAVYAPAKNLRWRNDSRSPVLIQASWDTRESRLQIHLFGRPDARRVWIRRPDVSGRAAPPAPSFIADRQAEPGSVRRVDMPAPGSTVRVVRQVRDKNGRVRREAFVSTYRSWGGVFAVASGDPRLRSPEARAP